jgi:hypothetical protein
MERRSTHHPGGALVTRLLSSAQEPNDRARRLRSGAPAAVKAVGRRATRATGRLTADLRLAPVFLIVGAQRAGTTSLFRALAAHPRVTPPLFHKGVHYFDINYERGASWYAGHFPLRRPSRDRPPLTGEASPYYMHHPHAPERIFRDLPGVRLLVLLRDPVERAYSAHRHELARGFETVDFEAALDLEPERLRGEEQRLREDQSYRSLSHQHHAYAGRGYYAEQLTRLFAIFGRDQVLVLDSDAFFTTPEDEYARVLSFLGMPAWHPSTFERANARPRSPMRRSTRQRLEEHFAPHDEALSRLLGEVPRWRR